MKKIVALLICLPLIHCSEEIVPDEIRWLDEIPAHIEEVENITVFPADSEPLFSIELIREQTFGIDEGPYLNMITDAVADQHDRLIVVDMETESTTFPPLQRVLVYEKDGSYLTQIGGAGRGPGEYGSAFIMPLNGSNVHVYDLTGNRFNVYSGEDFELVETLMTDQWNVHQHEAVRDLSYSSAYLRSDGNFLVRYRETVPQSGSKANFKLLLTDRNGEVLDDEPLIFPGRYVALTQSDPPRPSVPLPFMGSTLTAQSVNDDLYTVWTREFLLKRFDAEGNYHSAIYYPVEGPLFDMNSHRGMFGTGPAEATRALRNSGEEIPETDALMDRLFMDDENRIWLAMKLNDPDMREWWIIDESGELLAVCRMNVDEKRVLEVRNGYLYAREKDEETGDEFMVRYRIEMK